MTLIDEATETVREMIESAGVPGVAVALVIDGQPLALAAGCRALDRQRPLERDARFYLYSVTKVILAIAALRLVEQGRVSLDEPIRIVLPEFPLDEPITLRQLLNHSAGLPDYGAMPEYRDDLVADPGAPWTDDEYVERTLRRGLIFPPGQGWSYSNLGYLLVRRTIERLTRTSLRDALRALVFAPAGMLATTVAESLADAADLTPGYSTYLEPDGGLRDITRRYHPGWVAHGVAMSTAPEVARLIEALFVGELLSTASLAAMLDAVEVPGTHPPFVLPGYGLGLMVDLGSPFGRVAGHAGGGPGYSTAAFHFPDVVGHRVTAVALTNCDQPALGLDIGFVLADVARRHFAHG